MSTYFATERSETSMITDDNHPDIKKAERHLEEYVLKNPAGGSFSLWKSTPADLGATGPGYELYFVLLKQMILLFVILFVASFPALIMNFTGSYLSEVEKTSPLESSTLGNQRSLQEDLLKGRNRQDAIDEHKRTMYITVFTDFAYIILFLIVVIIFQFYSYRRSLTTKNVIVGDFAIYVELPKGVKTTEDELKAFFEKYGPVHECCIPKCYGKVIKRYMKFNEVEKELYTEMKKSRMEDNTEKLDKIRIKRYEILEKLKAESDNSKYSVRAFVIFETIKSRDMCLKDYAKSLIFRSLKDQPQRLRFKNSPVHVSNAPDPREMHWDNFGEKTTHWKSVIIYIILLYTSVIALVVISMVEYYEIRLPTYTKCIATRSLPEDNKDDLDDLDKNNQTHVICFCGGLKEEEIENDPDYKNFCENYWTYFIFIWILRFSGMGIVALLDKIVKDSLIGITFS